MAFCSESHQGIVLSPATTLLTSTNHELYICQQLDVGLLIGLVEMRAVTVNLTTPSHTLMPTQLRFPRCHRSRFGWSLNQAFVGAWSSSVNLSQQNPTRHTSPQGGSNSRKIGGAAPRGHVMESFFVCTRSVVLRACRLLLHVCSLESGEEPIRRKERSHLEVRFC